MYVNKWTLDVGDTGLEALRTFFSRAHGLGILEDAGPVDVIGLRSSADQGRQKA